MQGMKETDADNLSSKSNLEYILYQSYYVLLLYVLRS